MLHVQRVPFASTHYQRGLIQFVGPAFIPPAVRFREVSGRALASVSALLAEEKYLSAHEALKQGLVDAVIPVGGAFSTKEAPSLRAPPEAV